jgi:predicted AAA+ superfamily ATPase
LPGKPFTAAAHGILKCMKATSELRPRRLVEVVPQRMREEPVVILTGPRTVGKSTLLAALAAEFDRPVLDLDRPDARAAAASDPSFMVSGPRPVLIDEFQHVPEILDAIKAELNTDTRPGRYVLTGSTRYSVLWSLGYSSMAPPTARR